MSVRENHPTRKLPFKDISGSKGVLTSQGRALPIMKYTGGTARKRYIFQGSGISKGIGNSRIEVYERVGISIISASKRRALWPGTIFQPESIRNRKLPITNPAGLIQLRTGF